MKARERKAWEMYESGDREGLWMYGEKVVKDLIKNMSNKGLLHISEEDAYQEGMLMIGEKIDQYDPDKGEFFSYMWICARGAILDANNREANLGMSHHNLGIELEDVDDHDFESEEDPFRTVLAKEVWDKGMASLSERERDVITLRYKEENTYREIGLKLGTTHVRAFQIEQEALDKIRYALSV